MNLVKLVNVSKRYLNIKFNLAINSNDKVLIKGVNGVGKSTLAKILVGYVKPDSGILIINTKKRSYLEEGNGLPLYSTGESYIKNLEYIHKSMRSETLCKIFNIPLNKTIRNLSKGNLQKLKILSRFIGKHDLYVLDEPFNGIDEKTSKSFLDFLDKLINHTIVIITHFPEKYGTSFNKIIEL